MHPALPHPDEARPREGLVGDGIGAKHAAVSTRIDAPPVRLVLPCYELKQSAEQTLRVGLSSSELAQMNAIIYSKLGVVIERDVLARPYDSSFCRSKGIDQRESLSSFVGLYWGRPSELPGAVAAMASHHACGLVLLPPLEDASAPVLVFRSKAEVGWLDVLMADSYAKLTFILGGGREAVFAYFNSCWKLKSKRSPGKSFAIQDIAMLHDKVLGVIPLVMSRVSPVFESLAPSPLQDAAPCGGQQRSSADLTMPDPPSKWNVAVFRSWAVSYPDAEVARVAIQAVGRGVDPGFVGKLQKTVIRANPASIKGREESIRVELMKECAAGRMAGPFSEPPFAFFRNCPLRMIPKERYVLGSDKMRIISNFSAGRFSVPPLSSVNDLCGTLGLISFHLRPHHLRDVIASKGKGCSVWAADIPKCFRGQRNLKKLLPLFVYILESPRGREFFVDLCNAFGWTPSEYSWQCILAVLMWRFRREGLTQLLAYVDNFFRVFAADEDPSTEISSILSVLEDAGISLHEVQEGTSFKGLGWLWDLQSMTMICPEDKHRFFSRLLREWSVRVPLRLSLSEVRSMVGFMVWMTAAFQAGAGCVADLVSVRTALEASAKRLRKDEDSAFATLKGASKEAIMFWADWFPVWDREAPIMLGFTSSSTWEILGQSDASTEWGYGGLFYDGQVLRGYAKPWSAEERKKAFVVLRESTGVFEMMGALEWFRRFGGRCRGKRCQL